MEVMGYERIAFPVVKSESANKDGKMRQEILQEIFNSEDEDVAVTFKVTETEKNGRNIYSVMANGMKIGEVEESDRDIFELNIQNGTSAELDLHESMNENGDRVYTAKAILCVPYIVMPKDISERVKKRGYAVLFAVILLIGNAVLCLVKSDWVGLIISVVAAILIYYWAFIKKSGKAYDYIFKKDRKINNMF